MAMHRAIRILLGPERRLFGCIGLGGGGSLVTAESEGRAQENGWKEVGATLGSATAEGREQT
jgi:hypothetical protein